MAFTRKNKGTGPEHIQRNKQLGSARAHTVNKTKQNTWKNMEARTQWSESTGKRVWVGLRG
jgi:ribosomal protein L28